MFLISLKAGGFGLTLTEADYCFLLDPWWNPATEAQAIDRVHRIGQNAPCMVYRLVARTRSRRRWSRCRSASATCSTGSSTTAARLTGAVTADDLPQAAEG